jgi:hypothetical protein
MLSVGLTVGLLIGVGMLVGALVAGKAQNSATINVPETLLHATASHGGETLAMATGQIDAEIEGLFLLDFLTGDLQCWVINPRLGRIGAQYKHNVINDLGVQQGKKPSYVMVTGGADIPRGSAAASPAGCILYVADSNTGKVAVYTLAWNRNLARAGQLQGGGFVLVTAGEARKVVIRE